ncbi:heme o synthase [Govanella unica]|uniref:Protoheme IX farnesyltransferase n=1 Tax=Govanella unica TaxID=2975056 RepID=A0A9X3Z6M1_9PROT|nr:heme o synthase [Govania unica]MDA5193350.1 heme o synthase [Govania unica]
MTTKMDNATLVSGRDHFPTASDYWSLLKPRVMSLVVFTGAVGLYLAPGTIHPILAFTAILCIAVGAGASGCLNMWYDADIDARMKRTINRAVPSGRVTPGEALGFGITLSVASVVLMWLAINWVAAALLALTICFYVFVYTMWLKRRTPQNIVIGGAAGAFPPMIGWAAVTGTVSLESVLLFAIIFFWTPPHFWALSLFTSEDYKAVGVPMLPVVSGERETRKQILIYSLLLAPLGVVPWMIGMTGAIYGISASLLGLAFVVQAWRVWRERVEVQAARGLFKLSLLYLFMIFIMLLVDHVVGGFF